MILGKTMAVISVSSEEGEGTPGLPGSSGSTSVISAAEARWAEISARMQMDMETFSRLQGDKAGSLMQNLREVNQEKYDYTSFLKKFAVLG